MTSRNDGFGCPYALKTVRWESRPRTKQINGSRRLGDWPGQEGRRVRRSDRTEFGGESDPRQLRLEVNRQDRLQHVFTADPFGGTIGRHDPVAVRQVLNRKCWFELPFQLTDEPA